MKKCKHDTVTIKWNPATGQVLSMRCGAQLGMGWAADPKPGDEELFDEFLTRVYRDEEFDLPTDDGWDWDITRPVAGQFEEWRARLADQSPLEASCDVCLSPIEADGSCACPDSGPAPTRIPGCLFSDDESTDYTTPDDIIARHNEACDANGEPQARLSGRVEVELVVGDEIEEGVAFEVVAGDAPNDVQAGAP